MLTLGCKIHLKTPCHIGYQEKGRQILDDTDSPYIPSYVLRTQIMEESLRFAQVRGVRIIPPSCSDALIPRGGKVKMFSMRRKEYFQGDLYFTLKVKEKDAGIYLASLRSLQNAGLGADTSRGFGYSSILVVEADFDFDILKRVNRAVSLFAPKEEFSPPHFVKLKESVLQRIKRNWRRWVVSYEPGPFQKRSYYKVDKSKLLTRGALRALLLRKTGLEHKKDVPVCSPGEKPCPVCDLLGCLGHKSRIISRSFSDAPFLICENLKEKERNLLEEVLREEQYKFSLQEKEVLEGYLK